MHHYCPSVIKINYISNKSVYDPPYLNQYFMNSLLRTLFCLLIAITCIEMKTPLMGHAVVCVVEVNVLILSY